MSVPGSFTPILLVMSAERMIKARYLFYHLNI